MQQTNTADMLDLAVDYIKDLQKQVKVYARNRSCQTKIVDSNLNARLDHWVALSHQGASIKQICPLVDGRGNLDKAYPTTCVLLVS